MLRHGRPLIVDAMLKNRPHSARAVEALSTLESLQQQLVRRLESAAAASGVPAAFEPVAWLRDGGRHGGGERLQSGGTAVYNRASVNISSVFYEDLPQKRLRSANALSSIVHPAHPRAPSVHLHISFTALRDGTSYWRMMADLNPSHPDDTQTARFVSALSTAAGPHYGAAADQGARYFYVPALQRHRGVAHFYLEQFSTGDFATDIRLAARLGESVIDAYGTILDAVHASGPAPTDAERAQQLAYHTLYLFQVLTMDRGTTSGLLVHGQNDVGILGSLPSHVSRTLLASWRSRVPAIKVALVDALVAALPEGDPVAVTIPVKRALAAAVRAYYQANPEALRLQARGNILPPTVANHR